MIARMWKTGLRPGREEDYENFARHISLSMFRAQPGFAGCAMGHADGSAWVLTFWRDEAAAEALASSPSYRSTVEAIEAADLLTGEQTIELSHVHLIQGVASA